MIELKRLPEFDAWFDGLKDTDTKARLVVRLKKVARGNLGDVQSVGGGVSELREHFGPGWRMYFVQRGVTLIVLLGGGDKSTQQRDIAKAMSLAKTLED
ncbi:type II toxin-antitoxin system toxin HigB [Desulfovibrionales bacterium]